jgi:1A family penicillin-binding protein
MYRTNRNASDLNGLPDLGGNLTGDNTNYWVGLARTIPWQLFDEQYAPLLSAGHPWLSLVDPVRMLLGAIIIQEWYGFTAAETLEQIRKNPYLQYFIGMKNFSAELPFDALMMAEFRRHLEPQTLPEIIQFIAHYIPDAALPPTDEETGPKCREQPVEATILKSPDSVDQQTRLPDVAEPDLSDTCLDAELLEQTLKMPAVEMAEPVSRRELFRQIICHYYLRAGELWRSRDKVTRQSYATIKIFSAWLLRNFRGQFHRHVSDFYEVRPEVKTAAVNLKNGLRNGFFKARQVLLRRVSSNRSGLLIVLLLLVILLTGFMVAIILLPVPAPRLLVASEVYDTRHKLTATFFSENRRTVKLDEVPVFLRQAVLAVEDHRFYSHQGINPGRIFKAALTDLLRGNLEQGGSTITQQLVKNVYLSNERTFTRKFQELLYSIKLEYKLSKDQIFELYLNKIYFGHGAYGVKVAADTYFQKELSQLNQAQMALLAGLPRGPAFYSPYRHPQAARDRMLKTLARMRECGYINYQQYEKYSRQSLNLPGLKTKNNNAPYFMDLLQTEINRIFPNNPELLYTSGLKIESTLDLEMQQAATKAFCSGLPVLYQPQGGLTQPQGALIALDPKTGAIRALLGGTDYSKSQFNRAVQARRQPGSAFKPILYTASFSNGFTLASLFSREPKTYYIGGKPYRPTDHHSGQGQITLCNALAQSSNVVAVKLIERVGFKAVLTTAEQLGIKSKLQPTLSLALGAYEVTPLELTTVYATLANGGIRHTPTTIHRILDAQGRVLYRAKPRGVQAVAPAYAFLTTQALREVLQSGTAAGIGGRLKRPAAGKTGTTNHNRDTWFVGYTPDLAACVFVGCDNYERTLPGMASQVAAPIWADFMTQALQKTPPQDFPVPKTVKKVRLCKFSGKIANEDCPSYYEYFLNGTEPLEVCSAHHFQVDCDQFLEKEYLKPEQNRKTSNEESEQQAKSSPEGAGKRRILQGIIERIWKKIR